MDRERAQLIEHVRDIQRTVRTCDGCGLCCTEAYNSVRILPIEANRIAEHLGTLPAGRRDDLVARTRAAIKRFRLEAKVERQPYTCPFLESDFTCGLPFDVKPIACLAFNPVTDDHCEMDAKRFEHAHDVETRLNRAAGLSGRRLPIPIAVMSALKAGSPGQPRTAPTPAPTPKSHPLPRLLSKWHVASRTEAEALVRAGKVTVNGAVVRDLVRRVNPARDRIAVNGAPVAAPDGRRSCSYVLLNKPRGVVTTTKDPEGRRTVMDLIPEEKAPGLAPVGRLDQDSAGLILLTNDHDLAARLLDPVSHVAKTYRVKVKGHVTNETLERMRTERVLVDGLRLEPFAVTLESVGPRSTWLRITLEEGKNRQIRRQSQAFGHEVELVVRMTFGPLQLGSLKPGASRPLAPAEIDALRRA